MTEYCLSHSAMSHVRSVMQECSMMVLIVFFFSSRRRHTRYWRDWSSDVCSSDLDRKSVSPTNAFVFLPYNRRLRSANRFAASFAVNHMAEISNLGSWEAGRRDALPPKRRGEGERSEERRVGEEGRSRWSAYYLKK